MAVYALGDVEPEIHPDACVHPEAVVIGAGAVVSPNSHVPSRRMALGMPATVREGFEVPDQVAAGASQAYVQIAKRHRAELRRLS